MQKAASASTKSLIPVDYVTIIYDLCGISDTMLQANEV